MIQFNIEVYLIHYFSELIRIILFVSIIKMEYTQIHHFKETTGYYTN